MGFGLRRRSLESRRLRFARVQAAGSLNWRVGEWLKARAEFMRGLLRVIVV